MNKSKAKGTTAETRVVKYLASFGIEAKRKALTGSEDQGDIDAKTNIGDVILEVKAGKQTSNPNRSQLKEWMLQTARESRNAHHPGFLVVVRYNRALKDADVWWYGSPPALVLNHAYLDDWCYKFRNYHPD